MPPDHAKYLPVRQDEPVDDSIPMLTTNWEQVRLNKTVKSIPPWEWVTRGILLSLSVIFFTLWIGSTPAQQCTFVEKYFPANEAVEYVEYVKYKGSLDFTTPWRGNDLENPTPDMDAAWRRISTDVKPIRITEEQLNKMKMEVTQTTVKLPEEEGGGYLASLEITHHLQCLDMLRKAVHREYYTSFDPTFQAETKTLINQLDMCVDQIRQALMCYPDLNMLIFYWFRNQPIPDANTIHRCKNFENILDWVSERTVDGFPSMIMA